VLILQAQQQAEAFLASLDRGVSDRVTGVYLVGSAALGDWNDKVSNLDVVMVADEAWGDAELGAASRHHGTLVVGGEEGRVAYTTFADLAVPTGSGRPAACFLGRQRIASEEFDTPMTRCVLGEDAVALRGSEWFTVGGADPADLQDWAGARLTGRWRRWLGTGRGPGRHWKRKPLAEDLLEVTRLYVAASQGRLVSKVRSGALALGDVSTKFERVVADAVGYRQGSRTSMYWGPAERKTHSLELIGVLCDRVAVAPAGPASGGTPEIS
jgi:hypothetical protein